MMYGHSSRVHLYIQNSDGNSNIDNLWMWCVDRCCLSIVSLSGCWRCFLLCFVFPFFFQDGRWDGRWDHSQGCLLWRSPWPYSFQGRSECAHCIVCVCVCVSVGVFVYVHMQCLCMCVCACVCMYVCVFVCCMEWVLDAIFWRSHRLGTRLVWSLTVALAIVQCKYVVCCCW